MGLCPAVLEVSTTSQTNSCVGCVGLWCAGEKIMTMDDFVRSCNDSSVIDVIKYSQLRSLYRIVRGCVGRITYSLIPVDGGCRDSDFNNMLCYCLWHS